MFWSAGCSFLKIKSSPVSWASFKEVYEKVIAIFDLKNYFNLFFSSIFGHQHLDPEPDPDSLEMLDPDSMNSRSASLDLHVFEVKVNIGLDSGQEWRCWRQQADSTSSWTGTAHSSQTREDFRWWVCFPQHIFAVLGIRIPIRRIRMFLACRIQIRIH